jgi:hypothetical protein
MRRAFWARLALCREVFTSSWWARLGWLGVAAPLVLLASAPSPVDATRQADELLASIGGAVRGAALLVGGAVALAVTSARPSRGEKHGLATLFASRGVSRQTLVGAELGAAVLEIAFRLSIVALGVSLWAVTETRRLAAARVLGPCLVFGLVVASCFGVLSVVAGLLAHRRAGLMLVAMLVVPSALGVWWSLPSLLALVWHGLVVLGGPP